MTELRPHNFTGARVRPHRLSFPLVVEDPDERLIEGIPAERFGARRHAAHVLCLVDAHRRDGLAIGAIVLRREIAFGGPLCDELIERAPAPGTALTAKRHPLRDPDQRQLATDPLVRMDPARLASTRKTD
jgi:hypothetical protein